VPVGFALRNNTLILDTLRYIYLPRLKSKSVLEQAIVKGASTRDFFGTAYGYHDGHYDGFRYGDANVQLDDTLLLVEPHEAERYQAALTPPPSTSPTSEPVAEGQPVAPVQTTTAQGPSPIAPQRPSTFIGTVEVSASTAKVRLIEIAEETISHLASDSRSTVKVSVEIAADFPDGAPDHIRRIVSENAASLNFKNKTWE
jgi:hypothetical protein